MSGILGLVHRDGQPVAPETVQGMVNAMAYWGPDGGGTWVDGCAALGQLLLYNTPEALYEAPPCYHPDYRLAFTAEARIDNRAELCDRFGIRPADRPQTPDSDLILRAYLQWGEDCPDHLLGDWSFAVWHPDDLRLFLARDHHGNTALYTYLDERTFAFASSKKALLALPQVPRTVNDLRIAQILVAWPGDGVQTVHEAIERLPPAHTMTVTPETASRHRYWYLEDAPMIDLPSTEAYVEGFLEVFTEAVRCRLRSYRPVGSTLSSGLDSSSVTALAARELGAKGETLQAYTAVPMYDVSHIENERITGDEEPLATIAAASSDSIQLNLIRSESVTPLDGICASLWTHDAPTHSASNEFWLADLLQRANQQGVGTLLTGQGGNATVSWRGVPEALSLRELARATVLTQTKRTKSLAKKLAGPMYASLRGSLHRMLLVSGAQPWQDYADISTALVRRLRLGRRMARHGHDPWYRSAARTPIERRHRIIQPGRSIGGGLWAESAAAYRLEVRDPTTDRRVMEFCLGIPDSVYATSHTLGRGLIRLAMCGIVPDAVRLNQRRGLQAADLPNRLRDARKQTEQYLNRLASHALIYEYLDLNAVCDNIEYAQADVTSKTKAGRATASLRSLMVGLFILKEVVI